MKHNASMLNPTMGELKEQINNRYLLVNVAAQRARAISKTAEETEESLDNKPVTIALHEIADGEVEIVPVEPGSEVEEVPAEAEDLVADAIDELLNDVFADEEDEDEEEDQD